MANNPKFSNETVSAEADALARKLDNGYLRIYDGSQPATADRSPLSPALPSSPLP